MYKLVNYSLIGMLLFLCSCTGERYNVLHVLPSKEQAFNYDHASHIPKIVNGQELCVTVTGLNEESAKYFRASREREGATGIECLYYKVNSEGNITLPLLGEILVKGKSLEEAEAVVKEALKAQLLDPTVRIEYTDFKVSVLGEVKVPGVFDFPRGKVTILEALASAGGFDQFGKRQTVLVVRETGGKVLHKRLDLTSDDLWEGEYYYLHDNDVVVVESNTGRMANSQNVTAIGSILVGLGTITAIIATSR